MKSLISRAVSGAVILLITFFCLYYKGSYVYIYVGLVTFLCLLELYRSFKLKKLLLLEVFSLCTGMIILFGYKININIVFSIISLYFCVVSLLYMFLDSINLDIIGKLCMSIIYVVIPMILFLELSFSNLIWLVFTISWGTDTFAYLFGILFGKKKLYPSISPKKTVEGSIGGIFGAIICSLVLNFYVFKFNNIFIICIAIILSIISQAGDLFASKIKREMGIKDFGYIIRGHGGFLDRFDSIIFVTPLLYFIFTILGGSI